MRKKEGSEGNIINVENEMLHFKRLIGNSLANATRGVDWRALSILSFICLPLAVTSSVIYYKPSMDAGNVAGDVINIPSNVVGGFLVVGGVGINIILNGYFSYTVPQTIVDRTKAIPWPGLPKSIIAQINKQQRSSCQVVTNSVTEFFKVSLMMVPVILSTAQYVALAIDDGYGNAVIVAQLGAYGLMHWFSVTHFVENWMQQGWRYVKNLSNYFNPDEKSKDLLRERQQQLLSAYQSTISNALYSLELEWKGGDSKQSLSDIKESFDSFLEERDNKIENAYKLQLALLKNAKEPPKSEFSWYVVFPLHLLNAILLKMCYIGYDLSVWDKSTDFCIEVLSNESLCSDSRFIVPMNLITLFPLSYLAACIAAPENTKKLLKFFEQTRTKNFVKPLIWQRYPKKVVFLSSILMILGALSWGTVTSLNHEYIPQGQWYSILMDVNSILYNIYFHAFPIPYVALTFSFLISNFSNFINEKLFNKSDPLVSETKKDMSIVKFLEELSNKASLLKPHGFANQLLIMNNHEEISILCGNRIPENIFGNSFTGKNWPDALKIISESKQNEDSDSAETELPTSSSSINKKGGESLGWFNLFKKESGSTQEQPLLENTEKRCTPCCIIL
jgi:hypothetical protein